MQRIAPVHPGHLGHLADPGGCRHAFDPVTYRDLVRPCLPEVVAVARRVLGSHDLAWDAVQDALVALWLEPALPDDLRAWLVRTVLNRALTAARGERRRRLREDCFCGNRPELAPDADPSLAAEAEEHELRLAQALALLPREQREVFELRQRRGMEYDAIARELRVPIGTVRSRLARARAELVHRVNA
jgi:RNA polymerase sigma-70 factor (ECF subfamily)